MRRLCPSSPSCLAFCILIVLGSFYAAYPITIIKFSLHTVETSLGKRYKMFDPYLYVSIYLHNSICVAVVNGPSLEAV